MPDILVVNPLETTNWNDLLVQTAGHSFFHTAQWAKVLTAAYNYQPLYLCGNHNSGPADLLPLMEVKSMLTGKRGVCLPFTDFCEPLAANAESFKALLDKVLELGRGRRWKYLEIRGGATYLERMPSSGVYWGHELDLRPGHDRLLSLMRDSTRRNLKKASAKGVEINVSTSLDAMKKFCRLNVLTRRDHGLPPQPDRFFRILQDKVIEQNMGFIATASIGKQVIAANVYLHFGNEVIYKYGASDKRHLQLRANNLVMWEAIKHCCDKGFEKLQFGRTEPHHKGLMQFKDGWGAKPYKIQYYRYDFSKNSFRGSDKAIPGKLQKIISKLPVPILKTAGRILYRHMG